MSTVVTCSADHRPSFEASFALFITGVSTKHPIIKASVITAT